jgi:hypothetical protein
MQQYNIHEAKTHIMAKVGKQKPKKQRIGFLKGKISIPVDFDSMGKKEIENIFYTCSVIYIKPPKGAYG